MSNDPIVIVSAKRTVFGAFLGAFSDAQAPELGAHLEVFTFVGVIFFVLCYAMSQASYRLERQLGVGTR